MIFTTFKKLREHGMDSARYKRLAKELGGVLKYGQDTPITILQVLDVNGLDDALWALRACDMSKKDEKRVHFLSCDYAEHVLSFFEVEYLSDDNRPRRALEVKRRWVRGKAIDRDLESARTAVVRAARLACHFGGAAEYSARAASFAATWNATSYIWKAANYATKAAARSAVDGAVLRAQEKAWQEKKLREMLKEDTK